MFGNWLRGETGYMEEANEVSLRDLHGFAGWECSGAKVFWMKEKESQVTECSSSVVNEVWWPKGKIMVFRV